MMLAYLVPILINSTLGLLLILLFVFATDKYEKKKLEIQSRGAITKKIFIDMGYIFFVLFLLIPYMIFLGFNCLLLSKANMPLIMQFYQCEEHFKINYKDIIILFFTAIIVLSLNSIIKEKFKRNN